MKEKLGNETKVETEESVLVIERAIEAYLPSRQAGFYHGKDEKDYVGVNINSRELARKIAEELNEV